MTNKPRGRGVNGIYQNTNPPPPYVVTETKYRTEAGKYIDGDGIAKDTMLSTTKGSKGYKSAKQMSDDWIEPRVKDIVVSLDFSIMKVAFTGIVVFLDL